MKEKWFARICLQELSEFGFKHFSREQGLLFDLEENVAP